MFTRLRRSSRWAGATLLAALGMTCSAQALAQQTLEPPTVSVIPVGAPSHASMHAMPALDATAPTSVPDGSIRILPSIDAAALAPPMTMPAAAAPAPATAAPAGQGCATCGDGKGGAGGGGNGDPFASVPPIHILPRAGYYPIFPSGPGYYSLLDILEDNYRERPPRYPYPRFAIKMNSFFDIDWRYLDDPNNTESDFFDFLKRQRFWNDTAMWTGGGELRARVNYEDNTRLTGRDNNFDLYRLRLYSDLYITENFRFYAEFLSATSPDSVLPPLSIDRDPADLLNLFIDVAMFNIDDRPVWARIGRQELLYGSQRLISPLDWANTRRTFQGAKAFYRGAKDDLDVFWVQPVIPNNSKFDSVDNNINFGGIWYTHREVPGRNLDAYYLVLDDTNRAFTGNGGVRGGKTVHTFGSRWVGDTNNWLWDVEGMVQCGEHVNQGLFARAFTMAGGYHFKDVYGGPVFWVSYDYASGTPDPGQSTLNQTFSQLFPFGHYYFGFIDLVGRQNINDVSCYTTIWPGNWITIQGQCHNFWLDSAKDALYSPGGVPLRRDPTGNAGNYVGTELDFLMNFHLSNHADLLLSYSYMFAGRFIIDTATTPSGAQNPQGLYAQYTYRW